MARDCLMAVVRTAYNGTTATRRALRERPPRVTRRLAHSGLSPSRPHPRQHASGDWHRTPSARGCAFRAQRQARVKRRPATGESASSIASASARGLSASSFASRSGVSSPAFSSSIRCSHSAPAACSAASTSIRLVVSVLVDLLEQLVDELLLRHLLQRLAAREDQALVLGAGDAEVGVRGLADAVDRAAEHGDLDRVLVGLQAALDVGHHGVHVELQAAAGRAGDQHRAALAQLERLEDLPGDLDLLLGVEGGERDADRVADPVGQQRAEADGATSASPTTSCPPR